MKKHISDIEDLEVYRKAYDRSLVLHIKSVQFPTFEQFNDIGDQLRRASKSICANLAEGFGKQSHSKAEFRRYISMAIGSADEMQVWLNYCIDLNYLPPSEGEQYRKQYKVIAKMLSGLYKSWM